uniref:Sphingosine-1-phosphate lyase n=1 Tax=Ganoderma boninense TaxID=34458 RepID=A0A5K1JTP0_9APHY|nr:Sphingosine-1-phosphate lyase [Ganoderma boninense]
MLTLPFPPPSAQTLGGRYASDGRWQGEENVQTVQCDQNANSCVVTVPAPGAAIVYFSSDAQSAIANEQYSTYSTTVITKSKNTVTVDPSVLATSNGEGGKNRLVGGTSQGGSNAAAAGRRRARARRPRQRPRGPVARVRGGMPGSSTMFAVRCGPSILEGGRAYLVEKWPWDTSVCFRLRAGCVLVPF